MNGWRDTTIGGLGRVVTGSTPPSKHPDWFGDDLPFVTPSDITFGKRRPRPERWLSQSGRDGLRTRVVPPGSSAFVCIGATIGKVCLVETEAITNQQINTVIPGPDTDSQFLYSLLRHVAPAVAQGASGAATPIINKSAFSAIPVRIPDLETQVRIGEVLGALDDLIENNRRRVELLEEMARAIYREWFVKFRYPGHEEVPLVDSVLGPIPEGWTLGVIDDLVSVVKDTVIPSKIDPGTPAVGLEHIPRKQLTLDDWGIAAEQGSRKTVFMRGDLLFGKIRPYFHKVSVAPVDGISSTDAIVIRPKGTYWGQSVMLLSSDEIVAHATQTSNGTKMPRADWKVLGQWPVAIPPAEPASAFTELMRDHLGLAETLMFQNRRLSDLRDKLLPRLVTGQIDVSSLGLDALIAEEVA